MKFNWKKRTLISKKYYKNNIEICIYTDGNMYAAVSHSEDKCKEFENEIELNKWCSKFNI